MIPYYILALLPPVVSYLIFSNKEQQKKRTRLMLTLFFGVFLFLVSCRAVSVGVDNSKYTYIYETISNASFNKVTNIIDIESGFIYFSKIISMISKDYQLLVFVVALMSVVPIAVMCIKESENGLLTMALFLSVAPFSIYFSALRQVLAVAFIVPAYYLTKHKKPIWFVITVVIAMLFHQSAFIILLIYPLYHIRLTGNKFLFIVPAIVLVYVFNQPIFRFLLTLMGDRYDERYGSELTNAIMMILLFAIFVAFSFFIVDDKKLEKDTIGLRNLLVVALILQLFAPVSNVAMRINYYFIPFIPILMPKIINRSKPQYRQIAVLANAVMCIFFIAYFFYDAHTTVDGGVMKIFPYKFMWE